MKPPAGHGAGLSGVMVRFWMRVSVSYSFWRRRMWEKSITGLSTLSVIRNSASLCRVGPFVFGGDCTPIHLYVPSSHPRIYRVALSSSSPRARAAYRTTFGVNVGRACQLRDAIVFSCGATPRALPWSCAGFECSIVALLHHPHPW